MTNSTGYMLVMEEGPQIGVQIELIPGTSVEIGRDPENTIIINDPRISRHHARIFFASDGSVLVEDLGSTNGTFINGAQVSTAQPAVVGDQIGLADFVRFRVEAPVQAATVPWPPPPVPLPPDRPLPPPPSAGPTPLANDYPPPMERRDYVEPGPPQPPVEAVRSWPATSPDMGNLNPSPADAGGIPEAPPAKPRPVALYVAIGCAGLLLICCVVVAVSLWFAPQSFYDQIFSMLGIQI